MKYSPVSHHLNVHFHPGLFPPFSFLSNSRGGRGAGGGDAGQKKSQQTKQKQIKCAIIKHRCCKENKLWEIYGVLTKLGRLCKSYQELLVGNAICKQFIRCVLSSLPSTPRLSPAGKSRWLQFSIPQMQPFQSTQKNFQSPAGEMESVFCGLRHSLFSFLKILFFYYSYTSSPISS